MSMSAETAAAPQFVNLTTAAKMVGVGASSLRGWILLGWLPATREGWQYRISVEDLEKANERSLAGPGAKQRGKRGQFYRRAEPAAEGGAPR